MQRQPDLWDRVKQGGLVGGVILVLGAIGLLLAIWRMVYLGGIGRKVGSQMRELNHPRDDNPLGRIIGVLGPKPQLSDLETLELKLTKPSCRKPRRWSVANRCSSCSPPWRRCSACWVP